VAVSPHFDSLVPQQKGLAQIHPTQTPKFAPDGTPAAAHLTPVNTDTSVPPAGRNTKFKVAEMLKEARLQSELGTTCWKRPKWSRGFLWVHNASPCTPSATFTEIAFPLPNVPMSELLNLVTNSTITSYPHIFKSFTPVKVNKF